MKPKVIVGMSGGVDSSVAALLLKNEGYDVIGVTIKLWDNFEVKSCEKVCCSIEDVYDAKRVCDSLSIPHYSVNFKNDFKKYVIDYFLQEYSAGNTPSPCIICNEYIKFGKMGEFAESIGAEYIATGHYAKVEYDKEGNNYYLVKGKDEKKDQSYMLYRLSQKQLSKSLFPLGDLEKSQIREIAEKNGIITYNKKDSQGICFVMGDYIKFIKESLGENVKKGEFLDKDGRFIGEHEGYQIYTIGQRRGLGLNNARPYFVTEIIPEKNVVVLGEFEELFRKEVFLREIKLNPEFEKRERFEAVVRPRFSSKGKIAEIVREEDRLRVIYRESNAENAPGQHAVLYVGNRVVGGGIIG